jgi:hypothetical protein
MTTQIVAAEEFTRNGILFRWEKRFTASNRTLLLYWVAGSRVTGNQFRLKAATAAHHERKKIAA